MSRLAPSRTSESSWAFAFDLASALVIAVLAVIATLTFRDYGITWDETWHLVYGDFIFDWFASAGADTSALSYRVDYLYGGGFDLLGSLWRKAMPESLPDWQAIHLFGALVGVLGLIGTWRLARHLGGPVAGLAATVMLATTPVWYGHMFNNPKDMPFAVGYVWAIHALCVVAGKLPTVPRRDWIVLSITAGLAMSVRIGGLLVLCYLAAILVVVALVRAHRTGRLEPGMAMLVGLGRPALRVIIGAWIVMLAFWPWSILDPLRRPLLALGRMSRFTIHERKMPFAGEEMVTTEPRWDYLVHYFGLKLPVLVLVFVLAGLVLVVVAWRRRGLSSLMGTARGRGLAVLALSILAPPIYAIAARSVLYDGLRHFLFLVPLLCVVAGVAAAALPRFVDGRRAVTGGLVAALVGVMSGRVAMDMRTLHPHQYLYFNQILGGLPGAYLNYDTDYYGNSYKEAFETLADHLWETEPDVYLNEGYILHGCIPDFIAMNYLPAGFRWKDREKWRRKKWMKKARPDFYMGYTRANCHNRFKNDPVLLQVERFDTLLNVIRDRRLPEDEDDGGEGKKGAKSKTGKKGKKSKKSKASHRRPLRGKHRSRRRGATWDKPARAGADSGSDGDHDHDHDDAGDAEGGG